MKAIQLDFVQTGRAGGFQRWSLLLLGAALVAGQLAYLGLDLNPQQQSLQTRLSQQSRVMHQAQAEAVAAKTVDLSGLINQALEVDSQLNMPWNPLFAFMDHASSKDLALIALEPDPKKGQLMVTAEARDFPAMLRFYSGMQGSELFSEVALQSHVINHNVAEEPVRFRLRARWNNKP